jgi:cathepsin B
VGEAPALDESIISYVNSLNTTWTAGHNERFSKLKVKDVKRLCGVLDAIDESPLPLEASVLSAAYPDTFDARTQWPACKSIGTILDQGHCGSCWAFGAAEALTDRICIGSNGKQTPILSEQDLTSCDTSNAGCNGGNLVPAWNYMKNTGVVSEPCYPYAMGSCSHPGCSGWTTPKCNKTCGNGATFTADKHFASTVKSIARTVDAIANEILTNGPVEAAFTVYEDFNNYKSGVYQHVSGSREGGHAIKIIGWGTQNGTPYWLVANSWNTSWGNSGFFLIRRGTNEVGIEASVTAGLAKV